ncbi:MAG: gamma-glutamyltransferase [Verrucomicrobia bacterium]|nr:gamma-glutamyltransferase [Verrucomicrobiota bacterium]
MPRLTRRQALRLTAGAAASALAFPRLLRAAAAPDFPHGVVRGEPTAEKIAAEILASGGNAVDAIVAAALVASVVTPQMCGPGGYATSIMIASADGKKIVAIDGNSTAPAAARTDMFPLDDAGKVRGRIHEHGWLAAGVPGILAGLQLALDRHGTRKFAELVQPAIRFARDGFPLPAAIANAMKNLQAHFATHPGGKELFLKNGAPPAAGDTFRNPELADLLATLAQRGSVETFYRGDIAQKIADDFAKHGGLVTAADLAAHRAREVTPLRLDWGDGTQVFTAPLTAGGFTMLQTLRTLRALDFAKIPAGLTRTHTYAEALRLAWADRLTLLGDPDHAKVPQEKLLSDDYARECAGRVRAAVAEKRILTHKVDSRLAPGTIHLSAVDRAGNLAALTLTHGGSFGSCVTIDGLGLTLGHGMSRFEPVPGHPNSPGPGKRPLHNMCPSIIVRDGRPVLAIGGRGGRKIPNATLAALTEFVVFNRLMAAALAAPRLHTDGTVNLEPETKWPADELKALATLGYKVKPAASATLSAVSFDPATGESAAAMR